MFYYGYREDYTTLWDILDYGYNKDYTTLGGDILHYGYTEDYTTILTFACCIPKRSLAPPVSLLLSKAWLGCGDPKSTMNLPATDHSKQAAHCPWLQGFA